MCHYANLLELFDGFFDLGANKQAGDTNVLSSKQVLVSCLALRVRRPFCFTSAWKSRRL
jgi:hypothetical protein